MKDQLTPAKLLRDSFVDVTISKRDLFNAQRPLVELASSKFPVILSYKISKSVKVLDEHVDLFNETRKGILNKYGKLDTTKGREGQYIFEGNNEEEANKELKVLLDENVTFKAVQIKVSELEAVSGYELAPGVLALLDWLIIE